MENPWRELSKVNPQRKPRREISNEVFHALIAAKLSGAVYQIVLTVIDRTWGFNLKERLIPSSHFEKVTGLSRQSVRIAIKEAEALRLIVVERDSTRISQYMFNKHYDTWLTWKPNHPSTWKPNHPSEDEKLGNQITQNLETKSPKTWKPNHPSTWKPATPSTEPVYKHIIETSIETYIERQPKKKKYFFDNILLTEEEYKKLVERFGEAGTKDRLENLSLYKQSKGRRYASDYATVLAWQRRDEKEKGGQHGGPVRPPGAHRERPRALKPREAYRSPEQHRANT